MEKSCLYHVDFMWQMEENLVPNHATIVRFCIGYCVQQLLQNRLGCYIAMRMKEDHMWNGQLKLACNVQIPVNSEYIMDVDVFSDFGTLVTILKHLQQHHKINYKEGTADI